MRTLLHFLLCGASLFAIDANAQCATPTNIDTVSVNTFSMELKWDAVSGAQFYNVDFTTPPGNNGMTSIYNYITLTGLSANTTYCFNVRSICGSNNTSAWSTQCFTTTCTGSMVPSLEVKNITQNTANISWQTMASTTYQYAIDTLTTPPASGIATSNTSIATQGLEASTEYCIYVRGLCSITNTYTEWTKQCFKTLPKPSGVTTIHGDENISIYPNPAKDNINVGGVPDYPSTVFITDITGKLLTTTIIEEHNTQIDISNFPKGVYILKISGNNTNITRRFIKE